MRKKLILFSAAALAGAGLAGWAMAETKPPLETVAHVDLSRYVGQWFEIARYPNWFERKCAGDATAHYTALADGSLQVLNTCRLANGQLTETKGSAKVADTATNAKLKVTFFWPFSGNYWVIDLAPDYSYAVVGEPSRKYLWILSRSAHMDDALYAGILERVRAKGYDPAKVIKTPQR